jgi:hypothetical protein
LLHHSCPLFVACPRLIANLQLLRLLLWPWAASSTLLIAVPGKSALGNMPEQVNIRALSYRETIWMKAYLITTGTVFGLIVLAHICRIFAEGPRLAKEPVFLLLTFVAAGLSIWAWLLLVRSSRS